MAYIRDNQNIIKGDELWLFISTDNTTFSPVAFATQHSLNRSLNTTSVSSKDHGNTSYVIPGEGSWTCSTESLMSMNGEGGALAFKEIMRAFNKSELVYLRFGKIKNFVAEGIVDVNGAQNWRMGSPCWVGKGYMTSLQASGGHGDSATFSCEITGIGPLTKTILPNEVLLRATDTTILSHLTVSPSEGTQGTTINITPDAYNYKDDYIALTATPTSTITWNASNQKWTMSMPDSDVVVRASEKQKYEVSEYGPNTEDYRILDPGCIYHDEAYIPANAYVYIAPNNPSGMNDTSYAAWFEDTNHNKLGDASWDSTLSYWYFTMPAQNVYSYVQAR